VRVTSDRVFGRVFHLKTRGLAKRSQIEEIFIIFENYLCFFGQRFGSTQQHFPIGILFAKEEYCNYCGPFEKNNG
jgi:hypothetical protein